MYLALSQLHVGSAVSWICGCCCEKMPAALLQKPACFGSPRCEKRIVPFTCVAALGADCCASPPHAASAGTNAVSAAPPATILRREMPAATGASGKDLVISSSLGPYRPPAS